VRRKEERGKVGLELLATAVLALTAPAGYRVGLGRPEPTGWWLWLLVWLQSAVSVVYVHLRIRQRSLDACPRLARRLRDGASSLGFAGCNVAGVLLLSSLFTLLFVLTWRS
jgi:hypothetical protein